MTELFWISAALILYAYAGYPCAIAARARIAPRPVRKRRPDRDLPISVVIAARNEADRLPSRLSNLLSQEYRGDLQIVVVSDGSTDATRAVMAGYQGRAELVEVPPGGKASALNAGVARARHDIVVFADARQTFAPGALGELAANFSDPSVGGASGELVLDSERSSAAAESGVAEGVGLYWRYEKWLRRQESAVHSTLGATGAIYALRRALWRPLPPGTLLDDVLAPMRAVLQGYRVVFDERAVALDRASRDPGEEQRRKIRTIAGNYQILALEPALLHPVRNPVWWQYLSHKIVVRLVVPYALIACLVSSAALAPRGGVYLAAFAAQAAFYALALYGARMHGVVARASRVAHAFVIMNAASVHALVAVARGRTQWR